MLFFASHCFCSLVFIGFSSVFLWFSCFVRWFSFVVQRFLWFFASFTHVSVAFFGVQCFFIIFPGFSSGFISFSCVSPCCSFVFESASYVFFGCHQLCLLLFIGFHCFFVDLSLAVDLFFVVFIVFS